MTETGWGPQSLRYLPSGTSAARRERAGNRERVVCVPIKPLCKAHESVKRLGRVGGTPVSAPPGECGPRLLTPGPRGNTWPCSSAWSPTQRGKGPALPSALWVLRYEVVDNAHHRKRITKRGLSPIGRWPQKNVLAACKRGFPVQRTWPGAQRQRHQECAKLGPRVEFPPRR